MFIFEVKMFEKFKKKPFKDRLKDTGFLLKNSFTIFGKDKDIKTPTIHMIVFSTIITTLIFLSLFFFFTKSFIFTGILILIFTILFLIPFRYFYDIRQKADQSWIVYNTISGKDISYDDAHEHTKTQKGKLRLIAILDFLVNHAGASNGQKKGFFGILVSLLFSFLTEVWDLISHYMLPAVVIEQKSLKEIIPRLKSLKTNVPATLTGVFGIDFVGNVVGSLMMLVYIIFILIGIGIGYLISLTTTTTVITLSGFSFSWVPVLVMLYIIFIFGGIFGKFVESIKVIYFTIFYTSINHPMNISKEFKYELTHYLLMEESDFAEEKPKTERDKYIKNLADYISQYKNSGHTEKQIYEFLLSNKYSKKDVNEAFDFLKNTNS
jgi:hypothetical protein